MRAGVICLLVGLLAGAGCAQQDKDFAGQFYVTRALDTAVIERSPGTVVALAGRDGAERWRYRAGFSQVDYLDLSERYRLVCPIVETADGYLLLRYDHELHAISLRDGTLRWKADTYLFAAGRCRCLAVTPDSGVILLRRNGLAVEKLDTKGQRVWVYQLVGLGAAANPPQVIAPAGDTLLRTDSHLLSLSPTGSLNWAVRPPDTAGGPRGRLRAAD